MSYERDGLSGKVPRFTATGLGFMTLPSSTVDTLVKAAATQPVVKAPSNEMTFSVEESKLHDAEYLAKQGNYAKVPGDSKVAGVPTKYLIAGGVAAALLFLLSRRSAPKSDGEGTVVMTVPA